MKRETNSVAALVFFFVTAPLMVSQDLQGKPGPMLPSEILGPQLIAWSQVQKPQPVTEPLPSSDRAAQSEEAQEPPQQQPAAQTLTGTIIKDGSRYVLKVSSSSAYQLDDQDRAKQYEGKQVKVDGTLGANGNSLHVISIELIS
jgi:Protein of unknown function (DUF5818)